MHPDPAFQVKPDPDTADPIRIQGFHDQKLKKKNTVQQKLFFYLSLIKNCNLLVSELQEKPSALKK
jgi:hypothetical protein